MSFVVLLALRRKLGEAELFLNTQVLLFDGAPLEEDWRGIATNLFKVRSQTYSDISGLDLHFWPLHHVWRHGQWHDVELYLVVVDVRRLDTIHLAHAFLEKLSRLVFKVFLA